MNQPWPRPAQRGRTGQSRGLPCCRGSDPQPPGPERHLPSSLDGACP